MENNFENDPAFKRLLQSYVRELPAMAEEIRQAVHNEAWDKVAQLTHKLKGTSGSYQLALVSECAGAIELIATTKPSVPKLLLLIESLQSLIKSLPQ